MATATLTGPVGLKAGGDKIATERLYTDFHGAAVKQLACRGSQAFSTGRLTIFGSAIDRASEHAAFQGIGSDNGVGNSTMEVTPVRPVIVIDNYDSFTYNLCQYLGDLKCTYEVYRNDELTVEELAKMNPKGILISPGPGTPKDSGISLETILKLGPSVPMFGVCMGLQCMGEAFGGNVVRAPNGVMHGKTSLVYHNCSEDGLMAHLPNPFTACRYHSLVIDKATFPHVELEITAWTEDNLVMGARHKKYKHIEGVQFHPESIITQNGKQIVENFIKGMVRFEAATAELGVVTS